MTIKHKDFVVVTQTYYFDVHAFSTDMSPLIALGHVFHGLSQISLSLTNDRKQTAKFLGNMCPVFFNPVVSCPAELQVGFRGQTRICLDNVNFGNQRGIVAGHWSFKGSQ